MINFWFNKDFMTGGNIYNHMVFNALKKSGFPITYRKAYTPYNGRGYTYLNFLYTFLLKSSGENDLDIMDSRTASWCSSQFKGKCIIIMFHFDINETKRKKKSRFFFKRFLKKARGAKIVVIAESWENYLKSFGLDDIEIIYCAYDVDKYKPYLAKEDFFKKFDLPEKPIIYLGKNSIPKTLIAYNIIKPLEDIYLLITSGPKKEFRGPVHLNLDFQEYASLLYYSSVTLLLPQFSEGWSRIAHESIICGTPVIGNGAGGMRELLEKTNQFIVDQKNPQEILSLTQNVIESSQRVNERDLNYARSFDLKYFADHWEKVVNKLDSENRKQDQYV